VEIIRRDSAHPSAKWLEIARTSLARRHIRSALDMTDTNAKPSRPHPRHHPHKDKKEKKDLKGKTTHRV
jgi:(p)ppGpp synthase/HD superfamily hydrolase